MRVLEVFADVGCPFTHVGLRRLADHRDRVGADLVLRVRAWPLELVNGAPLDPAFIAEEVDELREQVAADLFAGFSADSFPASSLPAMALASAAYDRGPAAGERVSLALRDALFERGDRIDDPAVLNRIARAAGLPGAPTGHDAVLAEWRQGQERGVVGSPHFFLADADWFCPSLRIQRVDGHLRIESDPAAFDAFVQACLAP